jgi:sulfur-oxidizing protein SoxX
MIRRVWSAALLCVPSVGACGNVLRDDRPTLYQFARSADTTTTFAVRLRQVWNAEAYSACSNMLRFGHSQILTEADQGSRGVADGPAIPVNQ